MKQKRDFLLSKGLTDQEIAEACRRAGVPNMDVATSSNPGNVVTPVMLSNPNNVLSTIPQYPVAVHREPTLLQNFRDVLHLVVLLGGAAYGCYYLWKVRFSKLILKYSFTLISNERKIVAKQKSHFQLVMRKNGKTILLLPKVSFQWPFSCLRDKKIQIDKKQKLFYKVKIVRPNTPEILGARKGRIII
jgi:hypothetical protein